jgi:glycosyltransferase involved in cell wall biosynthesis
VTVVVPVWDDYAELVRRCLLAVEQQSVRAAVVVVDNASENAVEVPPTARRVTLTTRATVGAARNAGLVAVDTPYVVFADADDEIAPSSLSRSLDLLERRPEAVGVIGRSLVDDGRPSVYRGIRPTRRYLYATRFSPCLVPLLWLTGYQGSITSTVLRTEIVRDAGGFPDANIGEDWHLAARLARRGAFVCVDDPVRTYHRHERALRSREPRKRIADQRRAICADCRADRASTWLQRWVAAAMMSHNE